MDGFGSLIAAALLLAILTLMLKGWRPEYAMLLSIGCVILFAGWSILKLVPLLTEITALTAAVGIENGYIRILLRCLGITLLSEIGTSLLKESGQQSAALQIELAGRVLILTNCLPVFKKLLELALSLIH